MEMCIVCGRVDLLAMRNFEILRIYIRKTKMFFSGEEFPKIYICQIVNSKPV